MPRKAPSTGTHHGTQGSTVATTTCKTIAQGIHFSYSGNPSVGTDISIGKSKGHVRVTSNEYLSLRNHFTTQQVAIGSSRTSPPAGSLGEWLIRNLPGRPVITSYVAAILVDAGWAAVGDPHSIKVL